MSNYIVIYHGACRDGFCAAWVINRYFNDMHNHMVAGFNPKDVEYYPGYYGKEPPDVTDKDVIIVDFAYSPEIMGDIALKCKSLLWLDHHRTAMPVADMLGMLVNTTNTNWKDKIRFNFDLAHSGAGIAWNFFFKLESRPWIVDYVEDRDLWVKKLESTEEVNAYIACLEFNFDVWTEASNIELGAARYAGKVALMKQRQYVVEVCKNSYLGDIILYENNNPNVTDTKVVAEYKDIPVVNVPQVDCSEVCEELLIQHPTAPFSLYWFKRQDGLYQYGMRSRSDFDCSVIAKAFGGGGHKQASGFQLKELLAELR